MEGGGLEEEEEEEMRREEPSFVERSIRAFHMLRISEASTDPPSAWLRSHRPAQTMARITSTIAMTIPAARKQIDFYHCEETHKQK